MERREEFLPAVLHGAHKLTSVHRSEDPREPEAAAADAELLRKGVPVPPVPASVGNLDKEGGLLGAAAEGGFLPVDLTTASGMVGQEDRTAGIITPDMAASEAELAQGQRQLAQAQLAQHHQRQLAHHQRQHQRPAGAPSHPMPAWQRQQQQLRGQGQEQWEGREYEYEHEGVLPLPQQPGAQPSTRAARGRDPAAAAAAGGSGSEGGRHVPSAEAAEKPHPGTGSSRIGALPGASHYVDPHTAAELHALGLPAE